MARTAPPPIDPTSAVPVLTYTGGPTPADVPARDLHGGDLARLAYLRRLRATEPVEPSRPGRPTPADLAAVAADLVGSGAFGRASGPADAASGGEGDR